MSTTSTTWTPQDGEQVAQTARPARARGRSATAASGGRVHSTWNATIRTILGAATAVTLVLLAFAWPTYTAKPKDMPLAVVGSAAQRQAVAKQLAANGGAFEVRTYPDRAAAVAAIETRAVYGGLVLPATGSAKTEVLTASAGSPVAAQALSAAAQKMGAAQAQAAIAAKQQAATTVAQLGAKAAAAQASTATLEQVAQTLPPQRRAALAPRIAAGRATATQLTAQATAARQQLANAPTPGVTVTDVVPLASADSRGSGLAVAGLPLAMGGLIGGVMISLLVVGHRRRLAAVAGYGVLGGIGLALVLHSWFGFVPAGFWMTALVCGTAIAATASFIVGAQSLLGQPGIALGAIATMFIGNPINGQTMPGEWLPWHWGSVGQWFVPGAAGALMRLESYFPRAATGRYWLAVLLWLAAGVILSFIGHHRDDEVVHIEGATEGYVPRHAAA